MNEIRRDATDSAVAMANTRSQEMEDITTL